MKKVVLIIVFSLVFVVLIGYSVYHRSNYPVYKPTPSESTSPTGEITDNKHVETPKGASAQEYTWSLINEGYYSGVTINGKTAILRRNITDSDRLAIQSQIIDTSIPPDTAAAQRAANDPDAVLPDNMLPDGRFYKSNWIELENRLLAELKEVLVFSDTKDSFVPVSNENSVETSITLDTHIPEWVKIKTLTFESGKLLMPVESTVSTALTSDGQTLIAYNQRDMWINSLDSQSGDIKTFKVHNELDYDALVEKSLELFDENYAAMYKHVKPSPDKQIIAFTSNKNDLKSGSLFLYDINTKVETLLRYDPGYDYAVVGWIDESNMFCYKYKDQTKTFVAINLDGTEIELKFAVPDEWLIDTKNDMVAYMNRDNDTVYVGKFNGTPELTTVYECKIDGIFRQQGGSVFSPDSTKLALVYVPSGDEYGRDAVIFDIVARSAESLELTKDKIEAESVVHEVFWMNNGSLIAVVASGKGETEVLSTWRCDIW